MINTPSALKWLAEKRGRLAHDCAHTERVALEVNERLAKLRIDLAALDRAISVFDPAIDPSQIAPVAGWKGNYGMRGALRAAVERALRIHGPAWVSTDTIELLVTIELGIAHETSTLRKRWYDNTLTKQLRRLVAQGLAERLHDASAGSSEVGRWRWTQTEAVPLADLRSARCLTRS